MFNFQSHHQRHLINITYSVPHKLKILRVYTENGSIWVSNTSHFSTPAWLRQSWRHVSSRPARARILSRSPRPTFRTHGLELQQAKPVRPKTTGIHHERKMGPNPKPHIRIHHRESDPQEFEEIYEKKISIPRYVSVFQACCSLSCSGLVSDLT